MLLPRTVGCVVCIYRGEASPGSYAPDQTYIVPGQHELYCVKHKPDGAIPFSEFLKAKSNHRYTYTYTDTDKERKEGV